jgi:hypothetical protein
VCLDMRFSNSPGRRMSKELSNDRVMCIMHFKLSYDRTLHDAQTFFSSTALNYVNVETIFVGLSVAHLLYMTIGSR